MGLAQDLALFEAKLQAGIQKAMEGPVTEMAKAAMQEAIETEVYSRYDPMEYERRKTHGGLQDPKNMLATYDPKAMELRLANITRDQGYSVPGSNRLVAPIVEQGYGYTWKGSRIYKMQPKPRPFHAETERLMGNGLFEQALDYGLRIAGFDVKKI